MQPGLDLTLSCEQDPKAVEPGTGPLNGRKELDSPRGKKDSSGESHRSTGQRRFAQ